MPGTATDRRGTSDPGRPWNVAAALLAAAVGLLLFLLPLFATSSTVADSSGDGPASHATVPAADQPRDERQGLARRKEWGAATALAPPALVCAAPLLARRRRRVATITAASLLGGWRRRCRLGRAVLPAERGTDDRRGGPRSGAGQGRVVPLAHPARPQGTGRRWRRTDHAGTATTGRPRGVGADGGNDAHGPMRVPMRRTVPGWCPRWDSNPHCRRFELRLSANWSTGAAGLSAVQGYPLL